MKIERVEIITLSHEEMRLLNDANALIDDICVNSHNPELSDLCDTATDLLADIMTKWCKEEK